jgi:integrase
LFAAAVAKGGWWPAAVLLGYHCGMRWGDVCGLRWEEMDLAAGTIRFADAKTQRYGRGELELGLPAEFGRWLPAQAGAGAVWPELARQHAGNAGCLGEG